MFCENCGNQISDTEKFCAVCGTPVQSQPSQQSAEPAMTQQYNMYGGTYEMPIDSQQPKKKGIGKGVIISALAGVVAIAVVAVGAVNFAAVNNFVHKTFSSPKDYYRYVEKKSLEEAASLAGDAYSSMVLSRLDVYNQKLDANIAVKIGDKGQEYVELLEMQSGVDLSWIDSVGIDAGYSFADDFIGMTLGAAVNGEGIVSGEVLMDIDEGKMYMQIPELSETYIGSEDIDRGTLRQLEQLVEQGEVFKDLKDALPDQAEVEDMFLRYMDIVMDHAEDVTINKKATLEVEDIEQKCTELEVVFDDDALEDMYISILEEMLEDEDIEDIIINAAKAVDPSIDGKDAYEDFVKSVENEIKETDFSKMKLVMTVYVDGKGEIKGRKIKFSNGPEITELMPEKGKDFGYELSFKYSGDSIVLVGSGQRSGDKINGNFRLKVDGTAIADIAAKEVNAETLRRGQLNGKLSVKPSSAIAKMMGASGASLADMQLDIDAKTDNNSFEYKLTILYDKDELGELSVSGKMQSAPEMKAPKDVIFLENERDVEDWLESVNWNNLINNLEKADFPSEIVDQVRGFVRMIEGGYF